MQTEVVQIDVAKPDVSEIRRAAGMVDAGGLVAFPTETVYGIACRVRSDSLIRLDELKGRGPEKPYTLHISRKSDLSKYVPTVGMRAQKLTDNAWPGPLTVILELDAQDVAKLRNSLEKEVFEGLYKNNSVGVRCPDHPVASMLLAATRNAVVAPSANITGEQTRQEQHGGENGGKGPGGLEGRRVRTGGVGSNVAGEISVGMYGQHVPKRNGGGDVP
jgi:L-threonylcarbamoyladenylate synthase